MRMWILLAIGGLLSGYGQPASADATGDARLAVQAAYRAMDAAASHRDAEKVLSYYGPDFTATTVDGRVVSLAERRRITRSTLGAARRAASTTQVGTVRLSGKTAVAVAERHQEYTLDDGIGHYNHFAFDVRERDTWSRTGGRWLLRSSRVLSYKDTHSGLPSPPDA